MLEKVTSSDPNYPGEVCRECGLAAAENCHTKPLEVSTYHNGKCEVCGRIFQSVTEPRDFGYPDFYIEKKEKKVEEIHGSLRDLDVSADIKEDISDMRLMKALVFCDIDGILADCSHRLPYLEKKNYDEFYGATMAEDSKTQLAGVAFYAFLRGLAVLYDNTRLIFLTGRPERTRALTRLWLRDKYPVLLSEIADLEDEDIICRGDKDWRPAAEVKMDNAIKYILEHTVNSNIVPGFKSSDYTWGEFDTFLIDDDPKVIQYFAKKFDSELDMNGAHKATDLHPILLDSHRLVESLIAKSSEPSKSPEE